MYINVLICHDVHKHDPFVLCKCFHTIIHEHVNHDCQLLSKTFEKSSQTWHLIFHLLPSVFYAYHVKNLLEWSEINFICNYGILHSYSLITIYLKYYVVDLRFWFESLLQLYHKLIIPTAYINYMQVWAISLHTFEPY